MTLVYLLWEVSPTTCTLLPGVVTTSQSPSIATSVGYLTYEHDWRTCGKLRNNLNCLDDEVSGSYSFFAGFMGLTNIIGDPHNDEDKVNDMAGLTA